MMSKVTISEDTKMTLGVLSVMAVIIAYAVNVAAITSQNAQEIAELKQDKKIQDAEVSELKTNLARIEGKIDILIKRK